MKPFNPERFAKQFGETLGLEDLQEWVGDYLKNQGRKLMHRREQDLYEFMMPDSLRSLLPANQRSALGSFDRARCMKDSAIQLLAIGHPCIDLLLRQAVSPSSQGLLCAVSAKSALERGVVVSVLVRKADHIGSSAYDHVRILCPQNRRSCLDIDPSSFPGIDLKEGERLSIEGDTRKQVLTLVSERYQGLDFLEDRIFWISIAARS